MTMTVAIPSNLQEFIQYQVATGAAASEEELVAKALELYREMCQRQATLKAEIGRSLAEAKRGEVAPLDVTSLKNYLAAELNESGNLQ